MTHSNNTAPRRRSSRLRPGRYPLAVLVLPWALGVCQAALAWTPGDDKRAAVNAPMASLKTTSRIMHMTIGTRRFAITLTDGAAARAFAAQLPLTLRMEDLNGNEKHAQLPNALPANGTRPGTIRNGDLMLYGSATLVLFYLAFDSSYEYTRLGRVTAPDGLAEALRGRDVIVTFTMDGI